jgi:hypothetical protein
MPARRTGGQDCTVTTKRRTALASNRVRSKEAHAPHQWAIWWQTLGAVAARLSRNQNKILIRFSEMDQAIPAWEVDHHALPEISPLGLRMLVTVFSGINGTNDTALGIATEPHFVAQPDLSPIRILQWLCTTITLCRRSQGLNPALPRFLRAIGIAKKEGTCVLRASLGASLLHGSGSRIVATVGCQPVRCRPDTGRGRPILTIGPASRPQGDRRGRCCAATLG